MTSREEIAVDADGVMETPQDSAVAGWFTPAPAPGVVGVSVIAGHVTWHRESAVFSRVAPHGVPPPHLTGRAALKWLGNEGVLAPASPNHSSAGPALTADG